MKWYLIYFINNGGGLTPFHAFAEFSKLSDIAMQYESLGLTIYSISMVNKNEAIVHPYAQDAIANPFLYPCHEKKEEKKLDRLPSGMDEFYASFQETD